MQGHNLTVGHLDTTTHAQVLRIAFTSKMGASVLYKGTSGGNKPWKIHMTCPAPGKEGMRARTLTFLGIWTTRNLQETMQDMAIKKREFLQYASVLSTDFAGERRFWGGLPTEMTIRVTAYRTLQRFVRLARTLTAMGTRSRIAYVDPMSLAWEDVSLDNWMTKMSGYSVNRATGTLVPPPALDPTINAANPRGVHQKRAVFFSAVHQTFWTMPFSEMLIHGSHDAGCRDPIILGNALTTHDRTNLFRCKDRVDGPGGVIGDMIASAGMNPISMYDFGTKVGNIVKHRGQGVCLWGQPVVCRVTSPPAMP